MGHITDVATYPGTTMRLVCRPYEVAANLDRIASTGRLAGMKWPPQPAEDGRVVVRLELHPLPAEVAGRAAPARPAARTATPVAWYRRWSPGQIIALVAVILGGLTGLVVAAIYALSSLLRGAAAHGGKILGGLILLIVILAACGGGKTFSGTFKGTIR